MLSYLKRLDTASIPHFCILVEMKNGHLVTIITENLTCLDHDGVFFSG